MEEIPIGLTRGLKNHHLAGVIRKVWQTVLGFLVRSDPAARDTTIHRLQAALEEQTAWAQRMAEEVVDCEDTIRKLEGVRQERDGLRPIVAGEGARCEATMRGFQSKLAEVRGGHLVIRHAHDAIPQTVAGQNEPLEWPVAPTELILSQEKDIEYQLLINRIREAVHAMLPRCAIVIVVSKGDDRLLNLYGRWAWHFPQTGDGLYAGYYPADSGKAIAHLEALRARGGNFLVFPKTAYWWLKHYPGFRQHSESNYLARLADVCVIFALREPATGPQQCFMITVHILGSELDSPLSEVQKPRSEPVELRERSEARAEKQEADSAGLRAAVQKLRQSTERLGQASLFHSKSIKWLAERYHRKRLLEDNYIDLNVVAHRRYPGADGYIGEARRLYDTHKEAAKIIRETATWSDEDWQRACLASTERAHRLYADSAVLRPILDDWLRLTGEAVTAKAMARHRRSRTERSRRSPVEVSRR